VEGIGSKEASIDAEVIEVGLKLYSELGLDVQLDVNSIGHPECRARYLPRLVEYLESHRDDLCEDCRRKITTNPLRTFDCKVPKDREIMADAPVITDSLCRDCKEHFEAVLGLLDEAGIDHRLEPRLVRGLDYYTRTTFVYIAEGLGAQDEVGGGGRYDGLSEALGGEPLPGIGFGLGVDRILMALESKGVSYVEAPDVFVVAMGDDAAVEARRLVRRLRDSGMGADFDHAARSMKGQLRAADRSGARFTVMIGEREIGEGAYTVKEMASGEGSTVPDSQIVEWLKAKT
jgi:histidyl-tRNA synthetase